MARDRMAALEKERDLKRSGQLTSSSDPNVVEFKGADFLLTGKLQSLTTVGCTNDPTVPPNTKAGFNRIDGSGTGTYNGNSGAT